MKTAQQLKDKIKNFAMKNNINAQILLREYMFERFLCKVSKSQYKDKFIIKGGFLIAAMIGWDSRSTMDLDTTIKSYPLDENTLLKMLEEILQIETDDNIKMEIENIKEIREDFEYNGFRVILTASFDKIKMPLKIDITTGDKIVPKEINYSFPLMFEDKKLNVLAYRLETILSEKIQTVLARGVANTRMRDYYDVYILFKIYENNIDKSALKMALTEISKFRKSEKQLTEINLIFEEIGENQNLKILWKRYRKDYDYAEKISFDDVISKIKEIANYLKDDKK